MIAWFDEHLKTRDAANASKEERHELRGRGALFCLFSPPRRRSGSSTKRRKAPAWTRPRSRSPPSAEGPPADHEHGPAVDPRSLRRQPSRPTAPASPTSSARRSTPRTAIGAGSSSSARSREAFPFPWAAWGRRSGSSEGSGSRSRRSGLRTAASSLCRMKGRRGLAGLAMEPGRGASRSAITRSPRDVQSFRWSADGSRIVFEVYRARTTRPWSAGWPKRACSTTRTSRRPGTSTRR